MLPASAPGHRAEFIQSSCPRGIFTLQLLFSLGPILLLWFGEQSVTLAVVAAAGSCSAARAQGNVVTRGLSPAITCYCYHLLGCTSTNRPQSEIKDPVHPVCCLWWMQRSWKTSGVYIYIAESFGFQ